MSSDRHLEIVGYEVSWTDSLGQHRRILCMDRERAMLFAVRYGGTVYPLVRAT